METATKSVITQYFGRGTDLQFYLPRLAKEFYLTDAVVHWTMPIALRATGWLNESFHPKFREIMLHASARENLLCPTYCLMPNHIHLVWMGLRLNSDQRKGMKFLREHLNHALHPYELQHQAYDHILREKDRKREAFKKVCFYILDNPRRAEIITQEMDWPFCGAIIPGYPTLHPLKNDFWKLFWEMYQIKREANAGKIQKP